MYSAAPKAERKVESIVEDAKSEMPELKSKSDSEIHSSDEKELLV